jgi:hypothetical protein
MTTTETSFILLATSTYFEFLLCIILMFSENINGRLALHVFNLTRHGNKLLLLLNSHCRI